MKESSTDSSKKAIEIMPEFSNPKKFLQLIQVATNTDRTFYPVLLLIVNYFTLLS